MSHILPLTAEEVERRLLKVADLAVHTAIRNGTDIQVTLDHFIEDGSEIKFKAPVNCSDVTRLTITYKTIGGETATKRFAFADANGNDIGEVDNLFAAGSIVKVILDLDAAIEGVDGAAFVQNADTNAYLEDRLNELDNTVNAALIQVKTGSVISANNSSYTPVKGLKLFGKTTQQTYSGKNLLNLNAATLGYCTNNNGVLTANMHNDAAFCSVIITTLNTLLMNSLGETFTFSVKSGISERKLNLVIYGTRSNGATYQEVYSAVSGRSVQVTIAKDFTNITRVDFRWNRGSDNTITDTTSTCSELQFEKGSIATEYEPYTGGKASPSPEYPQPLESAGASGAINTTVAGKNWYDLSKSLGYGAYQPFLCANGDYYSVAIYPSNGTSQVNVRVMYSDGSSFDYSVIEKNESNNQWYLSSKKATKDITRICLYNTNGAGRTVDKIMVCKGQITTMTDDLYESYKGQTLTASTLGGLPGIPVSSGGNYTDENWQQWICDEVDFARGKYVQRIGKRTLTGSEGWYVSNNSFPSVFWISSASINKKLGVPVLCDRYIGTAESYRTMSDKKITSYQDVQNSDLGKNWLCVRDDDYDSADSFAESLTSNPITVMYALAEPIETPLSAQELAAYAALHTAKPNTTVFNDGGADMELTYYTPSTAVQMVHSPADEGKILSIDQHGCVVLKEPEVVEVPVTSVNGKTGAVTLSAADVSAVPTSRTVNNKALSSNISLSASDVGAVPTSRTVNGKALSSNISLSASDVGARPSTWTPTASDVGAAPASHATNKSNPHGVTAAQTGALPVNLVNGTHYGTTLPSSGTNGQLFFKKGITPADIGAAPAGFGYGDAMTYIDLTSGTYSGMTLTDALNSVLSTMVNGSAAQVMIQDPNGYQSTRCFAKLWKYSSHAVLECINHEGYAAVLRKVSGSWKEWEYINPKMEANVTYRTTERYKGKPVYVLNMAYGYIAKGNSSFAHGIANVDDILSIDIINSTYGMFSNSIDCGVCADRTNISVAAPWNMGAAVFIIKFTKL